MDAPDTPSAFLLRYLDEHFSQLEARIVAKIDDLKAAIDGLKADVEAAVGRDTEDVEHFKARINELEAQIAAGDATLDALLPELDGLRSKIQEHDLDKDFPAASPPPENPPPAP